jgi:hypothetical protein
MDALVSSRLLTVVLPDIRDAALRVSFKEAGNEQRAYEELLSTIPRWKEPSHRHILQRQLTGLLGGLPSFDSWCRTRGTTPQRVLWRILLRLSQPSYRKIIAYETSDYQTVIRGVVTRELARYKAPEPAETPALSETSVRPVRPVKPVRSVRPKSAKSELAAAMRATRAPRAKTGMPVTRPENATLRAWLSSQPHRSRSRKKKKKKVAAEPKAAEDATVSKAAKPATIEVTETAEADKPAATQVTEAAEANKPTATQVTEAGEADKPAAAATEPELQTTRASRVDIDSVVWDE